MNRQEHKLASVGDEVFYEDKIGKVLALSYIVDGTPTFDLECVDNPEQTCTAKECDCITMDSYWHGNALSESGIQY